MPRMFAISLHIPEQAFVIVLILPLLILAYRLPIVTHARSMFLYWAQPLSKLRSHSFIYRPFYWDEILTPRTGTRTIEAT